jgi:hypothetical protein
MSVAEEAAGTTVTCSCGRPAQVPSLREMRRLAGVREPEPPLEMVVEALLHAGELPEARHCVLCDTATEGVVWCRAECEQTQNISGWPFALASSLGALISALLGFGVLVTSDGPDEVRGRDRVYDLPLRACEGCRPRLITPKELKAALLRVPLYRRLLAKYPQAEVSLPPPA